MFSIKSSFANCSICPLLDFPSCIAETNCKQDISKVEVIFVAENPGKEEVNTGRPLVGKAGKKFRKYFNQFRLDKIPYVLTNVVLCQTLNKDGTTGNPDKEVVELCKENCFNIIRACNPKLIVAMGGMAMKAFGIAESGITKLRGEVYEWEGFKVFLTVHPSFVNRNQSFEPKFANDIEKVAQLMGSSVKIETKKIEKTGKKGIHYYKIPDEFYTDKYRLVDIQYLNRTREILYIFRDKDNNKVYHKEKDDYICYQTPKEIEARKIVPYDDLVQVKVPYKEKIMLDSDITYEGDMRLTAKHAIDYYLQNKSEAPKISSNIMYCDIEVDTGNSREFPRQKEARFPINMISVIYHGKKTCYVVDNQTEPITDKEADLKIFKDEKRMMLAFIKDFKDIDPDFLAGWNFVNFDMEYIYNRLPQIGIAQAKMSKFNEFYVDGNLYQCSLPGCVVLDQEYLYKMFTFTKKENYKLGFIAQEELGKTKVELPLPINEMYWKKLNVFIEYSIRDVALLEELENKLKHINLLNEIRLICNTSFQAGSSSFGQIDSMMISFLKTKNLASKNSNPHITKDRYPGAFVYEPVAGIYDNVTDFDFTSLYPSLIITYNIGPNNFVMKFSDPTLGYDYCYQPDQLPEKFNIILDPMFKEKEISVDKESFFKKLDSNGNKLIATINGCFFQPHKKEISVYSEVLDNLLSSRKAYKKKMLEAKEVKNDNDVELYNTRQLVYKVLANSLYGVVANKAFRFFDVSCASAITLGGQEALKTSIIEAENYMKSMATGNKYEKPKQLTKQEMYSEEMPDRKTEYIITGDTDSIFCCFGSFKGEKTDEKIKEWCDEIQDFLNNQIIPEIIQKHNVEIDFNRLDLKNELIISRGLFLAKKRYAIRVVNQEGKKIDEIVYMGVEVKRSDYPSKSKEFLKELTDLVLKTEEVIFSRFIKFIKTKENEFVELIKRGDKSIARPVIFGKKIEDYKTVPQGVRAMMNWNKIMYDVHTIGAKAYMFHVSGIDKEKAPEDIVERYEKFLGEGNKLDVIAVPDEEARLPNFFVPDVRGNLKFCFEDRYELLLAPIFEVKEQKNVLTI